MQNIQSFTNIKQIGRFKLRRCPFCGSIPSVSVKNLINVNGKQYYQVQISCSNYRCINVSTKYSYLPTAVNQWNTRRKYKGGSQC